MKCSKHDIISTVKESKDTQDYILLLFGEFYNKQNS